MVRVAVNGFGRIGRMVYGASYDNPGLEYVAFNDLTDPKTLAHLLKYDSVHGRFPGEAGFDEKHIIVDGKKIPVYAEKDPSKLPWSKHEVDRVRCV